MGVGEGRASWTEMSEGVLEGGDHVASDRERDAHGSAVSFETRADWALLLVLTAVMAVTFVLVAWLMS